VGAHEHGPQGGDELNRVLTGQNYGWPTITFGVNYGIGTQIGIGREKDGMMQPTTYWSPSIALSGLAVINSERYPNWQKNLLVGALKFQLLAGLELEGFEVVHEESLLAGEFGRIRDVRQGPDGYLYLLTDSGDGKVFRLE
jgi:glucose/arabinose dehydrogenase